MKRLRMIIAALVAVPMGLTVNAAPAAAADPPLHYFQRCAGGFCFWQHANANLGNEGGWGRSIPDPGPSGAIWWDLTRMGLRDQLSSIFNRTNRVVYIWDYYPPLGCWIRLHISTPGNWGDLAHANDRADGISVNISVPDPANNGRACT